MYNIKYRITPSDTPPLLKEFGEENSKDFKDFSISRPPFRLRRAVTLALLKRSLVKDFGWSLQEAFCIRINHHASGAPFLSYGENNNKEVLHISISHTGPWVGFTLSDSNDPVGFDLEDISKKRNIESLSTYAFSTEEQDYVRTHGNLGFYFLWGAKESVAKLHGKDLSFALQLDFGHQLKSPGENVKSTVNLQGKRMSLQYILEDDILMTTAIDS